MHPVVALFLRNEWATERMLDFCAGRTEVDAVADGDVYGGIDAMFNHIVSGETGYFRLVTGELPADRVRHDARRPLGELRPGRAYWSASGVSCEGGGARVRVPGEQR